MIIIATFLTIIVLVFTMICIGNGLDKTEKNRKK